MLTRVNFNFMELPKDSPAYLVRGADVKVYGSFGKLQYDLATESAWQFPNNEKVYLSNLSWNVYNESMETLKYMLSSDDGWFDRGKKVGFLGESTLLVVNDVESTQVIRIYGSEINVDVNTSLFTSKADARAEQNKSVIYTHGFSYDQQHKFLTLNSKVRVIYE